MNRKLGQTLTNKKKHSVHINTQLFILGPNPQPLALQSKSLTIRTTSELKRMFYGHIVLNLQFSPVSPASGELKLVKHSACAIIGFISVRDRCLLIPPTRPPL